MASKCPLVGWATVSGKEVQHRYGQHVRLVNVGPADRVKRGDLGYPICTVCGAEATRTQRMVAGRPAAMDDPLIVVGGMHGDRYEARCRAHHVIGAARGALPLPLDLVTEA